MQIQTITLALMRPKINKIKLQEGDNNKNTLIFVIPLQDKMAN